MFLPSIAVDPVTGDMAVGWYGTRGSLGVSPSTAHFFVATSLDGVTFSEAQRVSIEPSDAFDPDLSPASLERGFGEAPGMALANGRLYPIWSDNSTLAKENNFESQFEVATMIVGVIDVQAPPVALKPLPIQAVKGQVFDGVVATFTSPDSGLQAGDFTATIQWGDGGESPGDGRTVQITQPGGPTTEFIVVGSHTYAEAGAYPLYVDVHDNAHNVDVFPVSNVNGATGLAGRADDHHRSDECGSRFRRRRAGHHRESRRYFRCGQRRRRRDLDLRHDGRRQRRAAACLGRRSAGGLRPVRQPVRDVSHAHSRTGTS